MQYDETLAKTLLESIQSQYDDGKSYILTSEDIQKLAPDRTLPDIYGHLHLLVDDGLIKGNKAMSNSATTLHGLTRKGYQHLENK